MWRTDAGVLVGYGIDGTGAFIELDERTASAWSRQRLRPLRAQLHLRVADQHFCTGRYDLDRGRGTPCPRSVALPDGRYSQCFDCRQATGFNPAFYNADEISPQQQRRNAQPHFVYLAHFGGGVLKVGISYAQRGLGRLLEQGARVAVILSHYDDAYAARELEAQVAEQPGVAETVRGARKRKLLGAPLRRDQVCEELLDRVQRIRSLRPELAQTPELVHLDPYYGDPQLFARAPTDLSATPPLEVHGRCLGLVGDILVVEGLGAQAGQHFMCSLGELKGCGLELSDRPGENRVQGQMSLGF